MKNTLFKNLLTSSALVAAGWLTQTASAQTIVCVGDTVCFEAPAGLRGTVEWQVLSPGGTTYDSVDTGDTVCVMVDYASIEGDYYVRGAVIEGSCDTLFTDTFHVFVNNHIDTVTIGFTGSLDSLVLPPLCNDTVWIDVYGGEGGAGGGAGAGPGGLGGNVSGYILASAGDVIYTLVGQQGSNPSGGFPNGAAGGAPGANGRGGGGGGSTSVSYNTAINIIAVAGGGGGGGGTGCESAAVLGGAGGAGGGGNGAAGMDAPTSGGVAGGGFGGLGGGATGGAGGLKGIGCAGFLGSDGTAGTTGGAGSGGMGGNGQTCCCFGTHTDPSGGGGGGGVNGGGGGGGGSAGTTGCSGNDKGAGGGGGGGLSASLGVTLQGVSLAAGTNSGNGRVVIRYRSL